MSGFLRKVFGKGGEAEPEIQAAPPAPAPEPAPAPVTRSTSGPAAPVMSVHKNGNGQHSKGVELPLQAILAGLPLELQPKLKHSYAGSLTVSIPLEKILSQLSRGTVKITFGELRQAAPDLFTPETDRDRVSVTLPLNEILPRLNPALITRRREQRQIAVPAEISSPFDARGRGLVFSVTPPKGDTTQISAPASRNTAPAPAAPVTAAAPIASAAPPARGGGLTFTPTPAPPSAIPLSTPAMNPAARTVRDFGLQPQVHASLAPQAPIPMPGAAAPAPASTPAVPPAPESLPLGIALSALAESWPEAVRREIVQLKATDAKVELPCDLVEKALRQGKIAFTWKALRSWIKSIPQTAVSAQDNTVLELPLKIVAPLFLARQQEANSAKKKVAIDEEIPNLFFGFPQPESGSARVVPGAKPGGAKSQDTNYYVWEDGGERLQTGAPDAKLGPSPGTKFVAKYATPNEVASRAASLDGVAGALIALPDGLMVASKLSADLNGDTMAAFLPQIFGKVNQCTKELRMGELNNLNFTVGNVPWKIFRVNAIFFAAFGRAGEPLPTAQLASLAAELDHKPK
jgi:predicted regulator of Ras-like GTPase activity (Roadblock/LC7/MglB family)